MTSPALVDATDLERWADRLESQSRLPEVVRRLILATTPKLDQLIFPAGEGVLQRGWDGRVVAGGATPFVPKDTSVWELGTGRDVRRKAELDYARRSKNPEGIVPSEAAFIFVTPRRWPGKDAWLHEKLADGVWKEVRAYAADDLEMWLNTAPAVHTWFSELLGKRPDDTVDLETFWLDWTQQTNPPITAGLLLSGRDEVAAELIERLKAPPGPVGLRGESREEALAVLAAAVNELPDDERSGILSRTLIARSGSAWRRVATGNAPLLLIPFFDEASDVVRAIRGGHTVFVPMGKADAAHGSELQLPRLPRDAVERQLKTCGMPEDGAREAARVAHRSVMTFRRSLAVAPILRQPSWAGPAEARRLLPALLIGAWDESNDDDRAVVGKLARAPYEEFGEILVRWANEPDAPFQRTHRTWSVVSKEDMWSLLSRYILQDDLERFASVALDVLATPDPIYDLPAGERWMGRVRGHVLKHSVALRMGVADSIAMLGAAPQDQLKGASAAAVAGRLVSRLLALANNDWRIWASLSGFLALLAEAAPDDFMTGVERGLSGEHPPLAKLFVDGDAFFGSSPHTGLLWALEVLAWDPRYLGNAALLLARLVAVDPGGKLANRPAASLKGIFLPWHPQTAASLDQRLRVIDALRQRAPRATWDLMKGVMPDGSGSVAFSHPTPHWRDWKPDPLPRVSSREWLDGIREIGMRMLTDAGTEGERWRDLISLIPSLSEDLEARVLAGATEANRFDEAARSLVADALRNLVSQHRSFSDADWALAKDRVDRLSAAYERIRPDDAVMRHAWLFARDPALLEGGERDWEARQHHIHAKREEAVRDLAAAHGAAALVRLAEHVEAPEQLGWTVGKAEILVDEMRSLLSAHLGSIDDRMRGFARGLVSGRFERCGLDWLDKALSAEELSSLQRAEVLLSVRPHRAIWALAEKHGPEVQRLYWASMSYWGIPDEEVGQAVRELMAHDRPYSAVQLLGVHAERHQPDASTIIETLNAPLHAGAPADVPSHSFGYYVSKLLDVLDSQPSADAGKVAQLEWAYISALRHSREPRRLFDELSRNPAFFADLVSFCFRAEGEEPGDVSQAERDRAARAYQVLDSWRTVPGTTNGVLDGPSLSRWLAEARQALERAGRLAIGEQVIGQVLSGSPPDSDGAWPHSAVRAVIEDVRSEALEQGLEVGVRNSRGVVTKNLQEGGAQERALAERYDGYAAAVKDTWPRTATILRRLAASYRAEAHFEDERAEADAGLFQVSPSKRSRVPPRPPVRAVQSWIWDVFTPQLDHLGYENQVLLRTLSFRSPARGFERLAPLRDALTADAQHVFDDLRGDLPEYDELVDEHDAGLDALLVRARDLYAFLVASDQFRTSVQGVIAELRAQGDHSLPAAADEDSWLGYLAADVVNDFSSELPRDYSEWRVWNHGAARFKAEGGALQAALADERKRFAATAGGCAAKLFALRKRLSREYDIPVIRPVAEG